MKKSENDNEVATFPGGMKEYLHWASICTSMNYYYLKESFISFMWSGEGKS